MNFEKKLPSKYYQYANKKLDDCDKNKSVKISVSFTNYQACKLEKHAVKTAEMVGDLFRRILVEEGILEESDVVYSGRKKHSSRFLNLDCDTLKGIGTHKTYHFAVNECAQVKVYKAMLDKGVDLSFWLKSRLVKRGVHGKRDYQILEVEDLGY
jgi:hypothetical protein